MLVCGIVNRFIGLWVCGFEFVNKYIFLCVCSGVDIDDVLEASFTNACALFGIGFISPHTSNESPNESPNGSPDGHSDGDSDEKKDDSNSGAEKGKRGTTRRFQLVPKRCQPSLESTADPWLVSASDPECNGCSNGCRNGCGENKSVPGQWVRARTPQHAAKKLWRLHKTLRIVAVHLVPDKGDPPGTCSVDRFEDQNPGDSCDWGTANGESEAITDVDLVDWDVWRRYQAAHPKMPRL